MKSLLNKTKIFFLISLLFPSLLFSSISFANLPSSIQFKLVGAIPTYGVDITNKKVYLITDSCRSDMSYKEFKLDKTGVGTIELSRTFSGHTFTDLITISKNGTYMDITSTARKTGTSRININVNLNCGNDNQCLATNLPMCSSN